MVWSFGINDEVGKGSIQDVGAVQCRLLGCLALRHWLTGWSRPTVGDLGHATALRPAVNGLRLAPVLSAACFKPFFGGGGG